MIDPDIDAGPGRTCGQTGLHLSYADGVTAYRVAQDKYVRRAGVLSTKENERVGYLPDDGIEDRNRFDTIGRTVYFADTPETAFAEVLAPFIKSRAALGPDADAAGMTVDDYVEAVTEEAGRNGLARPWAVGVDWQMHRSIYHVSMPLQGWWVDVSHEDSLTSLTRNLPPGLLQLGCSQVHTGVVLGDDRTLTTLIAEHIRGLVLDDGSLPLGIVFTSKRHYGRCWAFWDRRADDGLNPSGNEPAALSDTNVDTPAMRAVAQRFGLPVLDGDTP